MGLARHAHAVASTLILHFHLSPKQILALPFIGMPWRIRLVGPARRAVTAEDAARREDEAKAERDERAEDKPVGITPGCVEAAITGMIARNTE